MRRLVVMFFLLAGPASAADFRNLDVGDPCASVRDSEVAMGSTPITWTGIGNHVYAFTGQEFGRQVEISYFCPYGTLVTGNYFIPEQNLDDAVRSYREVYVKLSSRLGEPTLDNSPWQKKTEKNHLPIPSDQTKYYVAWLGQRMDTVLSFLMSGDSTNAKWKVAIVVMPNKETREATAKFPR
jgi:hypothetical protein